MPKIAYVLKKFRSDALSVIEQANAICERYAAQGFILTLRQLYYQFVARGLISNRDSEYKRLGGIVNDARLAGLIDWDHLEDRTRNMQQLGHWRDPSDMLDAAARSHHLDMWAVQDYRVEVWIEKDALVGVIQGVCERNDVPFFSCRGYTSQSEVWGAGQRLLHHIKQNRQTPVIFHLGDHDPSGIDMTRDIESRLELFMGGVEVNRLALNFDQVQQYNPPPNPAKTTDSRYASYIRIHGAESWELDALEPAVIAALIQDAIDRVRDSGLWRESLRREKREKALLAKVADNWVELEPYVVSEYGEPEIDGDGEDS